MQRLPRRLGHDQHADLVEHLDELRARLVVSLFAVAVGFGVAYAFHARVIEFLNGPLPASHRHPVTFGVVEPFLTSMKVSLVAGLGLALPIVLWQVWSYLAPAFRGEGAAYGRNAPRCGDGPLRRRRRDRQSHRAAAAVHFLTSYDDQLYNIQVRAQDYYSFATMVLAAVGIVFELPIFVLALVRLGVTSSTKLRRNRRIGYVIVAAVAVALPGADPVTTAVEMVLLMLLFKTSIWLSVALERRRSRAVARSTLPA